MMHQAISIYNADTTAIILDHFHQKIPYLSSTNLTSEIHFEEQTELQGHLIVTYDQDYGI